MFKQLI